MQNEINMDPASLANRVYPEVQKPHSEHEQDFTWPCSYTRSPSEYVWRVTKSHCTQSVNQAHVTFNNDAA